VVVTFRYTFGLVALGIALTAPALDAQSETRPTIRVVGGATASSLASPSTETDPLYGIALGAQYVMPARGHWYLVPEVLLVDKGGEQTAGSSSINVDIRTVDLSLLARWSTGTSEDRRRIFAFAGPTYGFVLSCDAESGVGGVFLPGDCTENVNSGDAGVTIGGGLDFPSSSIDWGISLRYQHGLSNIQKSGGELRTRTVMLLLSYRI
jgi:Outer membrane protein beta-barrel domain